MFAAIPLSYVPIPGASNPVVVARVDGLREELYVNVALARGLDRVDLPSAEARLIAEFKKRLEREVGLEFRVVCGGYSDYDALTYVRVTNEALRSLASRLDEDVLQVAYAIDRELELQDYVLALRLVDLLKTHYAWRWGEPPVELEWKLAFRVRAVRRAGSFRTPFLEVDREALVHLAGKSSIYLARAIMNGDVEGVARVVEFVNGLWYSVYGLKTPCGGGLSTYVPGLDGVYCVEVEISPRTA
ncbi:MAG: hypothetical protein RMH84_01865 [Sulfolobales archaeon]|nr:hypothetical protein [Sulfolobales archaeon]MCX8208233.1 hypothetical protein [Sulfolobales archaeon]MDW8010326.1 hypothetical protein [Sulfolobales archaeon]